MLEADLSLRGLAHPLGDLSSLVRADLHGGDHFNPDDAAVFVEAFEKPLRITPLEHASLDE